MAARMPSARYGLGLDAGFAARCCPCRHRRRPPHWRSFSKYELSLASARAFYAVRRQQNFEHTEITARDLEYKEDSQPLKPSSSPQRAIISDCAARPGDAAAILKDFHMQVIT